MFDNMATKPINVPIIPIAGAISPSDLKIDAPNSWRWVVIEISLDKVSRTTSTSCPSTSISTPFCMKGLSICASSNAKKPPFRAASAISTTLWISASGASILNMNALAAILPAPKNCPNENCDNTTNNEPQNTIKIDGTLINIPMSPPWTIAMTIKPIAPIMPTIVAKSIENPLMV